MSPDFRAALIVRLLGSFTLAVESAAVYLGQFANDVTCAAFLARLKKEGLEGLDTAASQGSEGVLHGEKRLTKKPEAGQWNNKCGGEGDQSSPWDRSDKGSLQIRPASRAPGFRLASNGGFGKTASHSTRYAIRGAANCVFQRKKSYSIKQ
jgi:hypothetical protein